jgi:hypothetical protein
MDAVRYETFMRAIFSDALGEQIGRSGDPAGLAVADIFRASDLDSIKFCAGYAISIVIRRIRSDFHIDEAEIEWLSKLVHRLAGCRKFEVAKQLIEKFRSRMEQKYYKIENLSLERID